MDAGRRDGGLPWAACIVAMFLSAALVWSGVAFDSAWFRLALWGVVLPTFAGALAWALCRSVIALRVTQAVLNRRVEAERAAGKRLCLAAIESLANAVEGRTSFNLGHLSRVQAYAVATARALGMSEDEQDGIRIAALVHDIGRLGVPDNVWTKQGTLTDEEREKVRAYPVLGERLLAPVPFPWPVASIVRHHRERCDGSGYPDALSGVQIPLESRILAVVDTYDVLTCDGAHRKAAPPGAAMAQIERMIGTDFDPEVVAAFFSILDDVDSELATQNAAHASAGPMSEIARAQREVQALNDLARTVGSTLCLDDTLTMLAVKILAIINSTTCVFYLLEDDDEWLYAAAAFGVNHWHFRRSRARLGTYLTGRVASRGEAIQASFLPDDIELRPSQEPWRPLRSTLIVPLIADGEVIGTINLYHTEAEAFGTDELRVMLFVAELAGRAINNARLFSRTQESAHTDAVTGLRNRRYLRQFLDQELNRARKNGHSLAVLGLDLDSFKAVNDTYGHERGDRILREIAQLLHAQVRNYDLVARYAGDEFAVVLPETSREAAEKVAKKITAAVDRYAAAWIGQDAAFPCIGVSVGVGVFPEDGEDVEAVLAHADQMMYTCKRSRRAGMSAA